jgi:DNA recombination protein Rad52
MAFTDVQVRLLKAKLDPRYIKTRSANGINLSYVEGWHAIAEANRIFGFDAWDRRTVATTCVWSGASGQYHAAAYTAKVRVSVRAGDVLIVREGSGTGEGRASTPGQAHELALKGAETDATKRALATFGNSFGLALYDREQVGVRKVRSASTCLPYNQQFGPWVLSSAVGKPVSSHDTPKDFVEALRRAMSEAHDIELLYDVWEQNIETLRVLHRSANDRPGIVPTMVRHLRACAVDLVKRASNGSDDHALKGNGTTRHKIDKSVLTIGEPKRIRCKEHLRFVASQPCLICGRVPSHAHHIRYAQSRGLSLKVSDEFTVPLCAIHHHNVHTTGMEREWWEERNVDPLKVANALWQQSREGDLSPPRADTSEDNALGDREVEPPNQNTTATAGSSPAARDLSSVASRSE